MLKITKNIILIYLPEKKKKHYKNQSITLTNMP
jgi:hypothetical protein